MKNSLFVIGFIVVMKALAANADVPSNFLMPFSTDGCSMFVEGPPLAPHKWAHCCVAHDYLYWQGGTRQQRQEADEFLRSCVSATGEPLVAHMMYRAVRMGGGPCHATTYRWGYGWFYNRGYQELAQSELAEVSKFDKAQINSFPIVKPQSYFRAFPPDQPKVLCR